MENIKINKTFNFENGSIEIKYEGLVSENGVDLKKEQQLLNSFMEKQNHNDMLKNVSFIRTILKDYEEKLLVIFYQDKNGFEFVKYNNSNLVLFEKVRKEDSNYKGRYKIKYEPTYGIKLDYNNHEIDIFNYSSVDLISKEFAKFMNYIYQLKNVSAIELDRDSKAVVEIYKLFYNENPNFSDENINIKVQSMMSILAEFGISLGEDYSFVAMSLGDSFMRMPFSLNLFSLVKKLYPFGEIDFVADPVKLADYPKKVIKIVGDAVREMILDKECQEEVLMKISQVIYAARYNIHFKSDINEICEFTNCTSDEVESSIRLVKRIKNKIEQQIQ